MRLDPTPHHHAYAARDDDDHECSERWVLFALPGMGKSTFARRCSRVRDCDFGLWRKEHEIPRIWGDPENAETRRAYRRFVRDVLLPAIDEGGIALCNEPAIWKCIPSDVNIAVVLPSVDFTPIWWSNLVARCNRSCAQPAYDSFYQELLRTGLDWPESESWRIPDTTVIRIDDYSDWDKIIAFLEN